uniref:hypothetical protein n=1 Tax=Sahlingia subintegra TaxID=468936 RepID=UPI001FCDD196|nr:hypothetical protein MW427_pgp148 [Sahlingia subintegra]UNJ17278.1 hypothetical protein [Sahlingia subintegra]
MFMLKTFFPFSISKFLSIKRKTKKIVYTELSHRIKFTGSLMIVIIYKPMNIYVIIFFILFLLLIYRKLHSTNYILYKDLSNYLILVKFIVLVAVFTLGKQKAVKIHNNEMSVSLSPNMLVNLKKQFVISKQKNINILFNNLTEQFIKSIYRIEIASIISMIVSKLLFMSIRPHTFMYSLKHSLIDISMYSELNLIFTFASQIYFLISDHTTNIFTALKIKTSHNQWISLFFHNKLLEFFFLYSIRKKQQLKQEVMISAQLNSNKSTKAIYTEVELKQLLYHSNKFLAALLIFMSFFLICI